MRGEERQQRPMLMVLDLEQRVPKEHPLRRIKQLAETVLQGLSASFDRMYSATGRPSIPPERLLKASLLMALYTVRSAISKDPFNSRSGGIDGRPTVLYISSNSGESCASATSAAAFMRRSGCPFGTRCSGLITTS